MHILKHPFTRILFGAFLTITVLNACLQQSELEVSNKAGLLIQHADGTRNTICIEFLGEEITGEELLDLTEIPYVSDVTNPMGTKVCSIDGDGCDFPAEKCFCQCGNIGPCTYWAYFALIDGERWVYSPLGAKARTLKHGDVDAWAWLSKASKNAESIEPTLPVITFEEICGE